MKSWNKGMKIVFWLLLVCVIVQVLCTLVGTIIMFGDYKTIKYSYSDKTYTDPTPSTGLLPLGVTILLLGAMLLLILSARKGPIIAVCTLILIVLADVLSALASVPVHSAAAQDGYIWIFSAMILSPFSLLLVSLYLVLAKVYGFGARGSVIEFENAADALEELRSLYDLDAVTEEEYEARKAKLFADYRLLFGSEALNWCGTFVCGQKKVMLTDHSEFLILVKNQVKRSGSVSESADAFTLHATDGTTFVLRKSGRDLRAQSGSIYRKTRG